MCGIDQRSSQRQSHSIASLSNGSRANLRVLDLDPGDPAVFEPYWRKMGDKCMVVIPGCDLMSYKATASKVCWFLLPELLDAIVRFHQLVGNAVVDERYVVVGTGSTQLFQAALYALSSPASLKPIHVVSAAPYYSGYPEETDYLCSRLYKWGGDAKEYDAKKNGPFIEVVNYPNNPEGSLRQSVVKDCAQGNVIHDLAYYWPQFTPINRPADHDLMYFTFSKCTGHAGCRIGWALVKDREVAIKMTRYIELSSIGVSKDSQFRTAKIIEMICNDYKKIGYNFSNNFFEYGNRLMGERWESLRAVIGQSDLLSLPTFEEQYCLFLGRPSQPYPAFAWLKCKEEIEDCGSFLREYKIEGRSGGRFGADPKYLRISMLSSDDVFQEFLGRLSAIQILEQHCNSKSTISKEK